MSKRKDNKKRVLRKGEGQRPDGRYYFKYKDAKGNIHFVYSWKLEPHDVPPAGKKNEESLREIEKKIIRNVEDGILGYDSKLTVLQLVERYLQQKEGMVRHNTLAGYKFVTNILKKEAFGNMPIGHVKLSDARRWLIKLQKKDGRGYSSIHSIRGVLRPAFQMAVEDDMINKNPFQFELASVVVNDSVTRKAISRAEQRNFLDFVANDRHFSRYYDGIYILFYTGLRISEFVGLTINDIDLKGKKITVDHQLQRKRDMKYIIEETKTVAGIRTIPITDDVCAAFKRIIMNRKKPKVEPMIDGKVGFLYLDKNGMPMVALHWEKYFQHICQKYNSIYKVQMPKVTPHVCRHTYCSNMAHSGMNPKTLQYLMGHSDISVTLNTYAHTSFDQAEEELKKLNIQKL
ncbi:site-specific integrase [Anaerovibrio lipolyticus]|uniref:site-specific integrase n=1 Tax=Anaerovibrio lipolyticus TaxID=82374 RepID=UPI0026F347C0|nr:site-specific integrase [Anaerovibrio lipolyticus]MBE6106763.1 site-specific integrase [Anaerovibrio lipolyticus]